MKTSIRWPAAALALLLASLLMARATSASAQDALTADILALKKSWAEANYGIPDREARAKAMQALEPRAQAIADHYPQRAEPLIWQGIISSTYADAHGSLGALGAAKKARGLLEKAIKIDERALDGSALASLGVLYDKVPGFPVGFGDDDKARQLLERALVVSPGSIDANFFFADYLAGHDDVPGAIRHLEAAIAAPDRPGQELADQGRRARAKELLAKLRG
jgi:tetratricopeptide (TPR) repeat protein